MFTLKKCLPGGCHVVTKHIFAGRKAGLRHNERVWTGASNIPVLHQVWKEKKNIKTNTKPSKFDNCLFALFHFILIFPIVHDDVLFHPTRSFIWQN